MRTPRLAAWIAASAAVVALAAPVAASAAPRVYAAASLRDVFPQIDGSPTYNFAGSNTLQLQIERGAPADVFASASPKEAQALFREGRASGRSRSPRTSSCCSCRTRTPGNVRSVYSLRPGGRKRLAIGVARRADRRLHAAAAGAHAAGLGCCAKHGQQRVQRRRASCPRSRSAPPTPASPTSPTAGSPRDRIERAPAADAGRSRRSATRSAPSSARAATRAGAQDVHHEGPLAARPRHPASTPASACRRAG